MQPSEPPATYPVAQNALANQPINYQPLNAMKHTALAVLKTGMGGYCWLVTGLVTAVAIVPVFISPLGIRFGFLVLIIYGIFFSRLTVKYQNQVWQAFGAANNWPLDTESDPEDVISASLQFGHSHKFSPIIQLPINGVATDLFTYDTTTGSGKNSETHCFTLAVMRMPTYMPHLMLKPKVKFFSTGNAVTSDLVDTQKIQLEGDFNDYFTLEIEKGQQIDALAVITPDIMQTLRTYNTNETIEMLDDRLFIIKIGDDRSANDVQKLLESTAALATDLIQNAHLSTVSTAVPVASNPIPNDSNPLATAPSVQSTEPITVG